MLKAPSSEDGAGTRTEPSRYAAKSWRASSAVSVIVWLFYFDRLGAYVGCTTSFWTKLRAIDGGVTARDLCHEPGAGVGGGGANPAGGRFGGRCGHCGERGAGRRR